MLGNFLLSFAMGGTISLHVLGAVAGHEASEELLIRIYDLAELRTGDLKQSVAEAARILTAAGVSTKWELGDTGDEEAHVLDQTSHGYARVRDSRNHLVVRLVRGLPLTSHPNALGFALPEATFGPHVSIHYDRVYALAKLIHAARSAILGAAIAHEIGHVLLGPAKHSTNGLMKARWSGEDLQRATQGQLMFTPVECAGIRQGAIRRMRTVVADELSVQTSARLPILLDVRSATPRSGSIR